MTTGRETHSIISDCPSCPQCGYIMEPGKAPGPLDSPEAIWRELAQYADKKKEHFLAIYLDAMNREIGREVISVGTLTASLVHPRETFGPALKLRAAAVIVAHNHPSGDPTPNRDDKSATRRLADAGRLLGLPLLDHVIITKGRFFSFRERGLL